MPYDPSLNEIGPLQDRTPTVASAPREHVASSHTSMVAVLWPLYIFARPKRFFESLALVHTRSLTFACVMVLGLAGAIGRMNGRMVTPSGAMPWATSWSTYWTVALLFGTVAALFTLVIGGWWYRCRLRWCGVEDPDKAVSNRVYVAAAQVFALPQVVAWFLAPTLFATPLDAAESDAAGVWALIMLPLFLYSFVVSYIGVRTVFRARTWPARIWFLILPIAVLVGAFLIGILAALALAARP